MDLEKLHLLQQRKKHQGPKRFHNNQRLDQHGMGGFIKWFRDARKDGQKVFPPAISYTLTEPSEKIHHNKNESLLTWIGHSTFLIQRENINILTDPVFSDRCFPVQFMGPKRIVKAALQIDELPEIDYVLISHSHYDHLDYDSVMALVNRKQNRELTFFVPLKLKHWFTGHGIKNVVELDWWDMHESKQARFFCVPAQHFSGRHALDRNKTLWCGWVVELAGYRLFFAGDTGYCDDFKIIGEVFGDMDLSLLPIGAYEPRWFMKFVHTNPADAVKIHQDVGSKFSVGMHWGTFILTSEPVDAPPKALKQALAEKQLHEKNFIVMQHGETRVLEVTHKDQAPAPQEDTHLS